MIERDALEYLVEMGQEKQEIIEVEGFNYSTQRLNLISEPIAESLKTTSLTSLVDYVNSVHSDLQGEELLVHVESPNRVRLYGALNETRDRECFMLCEAILPSNIRYNDFIDTERFNIMLQSSFVENNDKKLLLKVTGCIQDDAVKAVSDDGVSQGVTIKTGVASVNTVAVPNPVTLIPFRSFQEIEQVESKFIFRMQSGPRAAIFEADGHMWRNEAILRIKNYLDENLPTEVSVLA